MSCALFTKAQYKLRSIADLSVAVLVSLASTPDKMAQQ